MKNFIFLFLSFLAFSCAKENASDISLLNEINSASVAFVKDSELMQNFYQNPTRAYISGYFYFNHDLAEDIVFGLDLEWFEGVNNPVNFEGADWMALAGFTRQGILLFPTGSPENLQGIPTNTEKWETRDIGTPLTPGTWYKMTIKADFAIREFISVRLEGGGIDITEDLSGIPLEYPNYIPFDKPSLTMYTFALRSKEFSPHNLPSSKVYFDELEAGILADTSYVIVFKNGFDTQAQLQDIPFTLPVSSLDVVLKDFWYFENGQAKVKIVNDIQKEGSQSIECDADLMK